MQNQIKKLFFSSIILTMNTYGQVGIGTITPLTSAALDVTSTSKGLLPPRMTESQRNAISAPVAGLIIWCSDCGLYGETQVYNGSLWTNMVGGNVSEVKTITSPTTNRVWMDRNLGATNRAQSATDHLAYGSLFQWGRGADNHQLITYSSSTAGSPVNTTTTTLSTTNNPGNASFIITTSSPYNWINPNNNILWQGVNGINNPCPAGYRIPTATEFQQEFTNHPITNAATAFQSPLLLPSPGFRDYTTGNLNSVGSRGTYWTSDVVDYTRATYFSFDSTTASGSNGLTMRAFGILYGV